MSPTPSIIARSPQKKRGLLIGGAVGAAVLTAGVLVALKAGVSDAPTASVTSLAATPGSTSPTPTPPAPRPPVKAETPPPTPTPATQNVQISFGSEPAGAEVTKADGTRLGVTPFVLDVERGAPSFDVTFTIAGRKTETRTVSADDRALSVVFAAPPAEPAEKPPEPQPVADTKPAADVPRPAERPKAKPARPKPRPSDKELIKTTFDN